MIYLSANHQPYAKIKVRLGRQWILVDSLIDTGFSAGLALPERYLIFMKTTSKWKQAFELADGSLVEFNLYKLTVKIADKHKIVSAVFSKSNDALAGIELLDGFRLELDLKKYKISLT
ncbi:hypothetical protein A3D03_00150 [Candidatus Gottesmanbacteria bacterium RIFCSPHIGHO2_02_FULL_40_13]|uniref:Aspartyl protease n=1 Tax=Candidatus Gottesmanbacteria bacterium RIFCSPHIGHO2_02_FULL_40_13 TaxID=1798384 RepID=A0A1F6ACN7_9BACT|nr:MAG: hypothetical protein A3D03_00150 [Candidatus Gottesmanbacteria bacterium RIFCSPHIGHO2_02_FULL_40_13]